jgi:hypothetical protein
MNITGGSRGRSVVSYSGGVDERPKKRRRSSADTSDSPTPLPQAISADSAADKTRFLHRSTVEIEWTHVAEMFEPVALDGQVDSSKRTQPSPSPRSGAEKPADAISSPGSNKGPIIAPFCRPFDCSRLNEESGDDEEDAEEEDLRHEVVLARHQEVLDDMKQKLEHAMKMRQQLQDKQKSRLVDRHA